MKCLFEIGEHVQITAMEKHGHAIIGESAEAAGAALDIKCFITLPWSSAAGRPGKPIVDHRRIPDFPDRWMTAFR